MTIRDRVCLDMRSPSDEVGVRGALTLNSRHARLLRFCSSLAPTPVCALSIAADSLWYQTLITIHAPAHPPLYPPFPRLLSFLSPVPLHLLPPSLVDPLMRSFHHKENAEDGPHPLSNPASRADPILTVPRTRQSRPSFLRLVVRATRSWKH